MDQVRSDELKQLLKDLEDSSSGSVGSRSSSMDSQVPSSGSKSSKNILVLGGLIVLLLVLGTAAYFFKGKMMGNRAVPNSEIKLSDLSQEDIEALPGEVDPQEADIAAYTTIKDIPSGGTKEIIGSEDRVTLSGSVCFINDELPGGRVAFYDADASVMVTHDIPEGESDFLIALPPGNYVAVYEASEAGLYKGIPKFAYTDYITCGMDQQKCTDHTPLVMSLKAKGVYKGIKVCDPQYIDAAMPNALKQKPTTGNE